MSRRTFGALTLGSLVAGRTLAASYAGEARGGMIGGAVDAIPALDAIEARTGGRLGMFAARIGSGSSVAHRADEPFAMCSTYKFLVGAAVLAGVEEGRFRLDQRIPYGLSDILDYAPVTKRNLSAGGMPLEALGEAAVRWSDNTAANLLLRLLGGPPAWTRFARSIGDDVSRLDRYEPFLNSVSQDDPRDTSSPRAMCRSLATIMFGDVLRDVSRGRLKKWMLDAEVTKTLFRAGLPAGWHVADKSGAGANGTRNDVGILYPPRAAPIVLAVFQTDSSAAPVRRDEVIAECAKIAIGQLAT